MIHWDSQFQSPYMATTVYSTPSFYIYYILNIELRILKSLWLLNWIRFAQSNLLVIDEKDKFKWRGNLTQFDRFVEDILYV
jgi:hypothetical protein